MKIINAHPGMSEAMTQAKQKILLKILKILF